MAFVTIKENTRRISCKSGDNLMRVLLEDGVYVNNPCNGKGTCGKCKVRIWTKEINGEVCLSCMTMISEDMEIELLQEERTTNVMTAGYIPEFKRDDGLVGYGLAIDIGTTTVVASLVDLNNGEELSLAADVNAQKLYGQDVLTRITYEYEESESGIQRLRDAIVDQMNDMIESVCQDSGVLPDSILRVAVAANCTMMHMFLGTDARSIGRAPYKPKFLEAQERPARSAGLKVSEKARLWCLPQVSAYIGADIVAGAYVCELQKAVGNILFIDIGTNGEIVLASGGKLLCCSCAAGPALEGMNISAGMRAEAGAIEDVKITEEGIVLTTIGGEKPEGLCGSGILAVITELLRTGIIKKNGAFIKKESLEAEDYRNSIIRMNGTKRELVLCKEPEIIVTQGDIRQVQLAKGAILSGFIALLQRAGIHMSDIDKVVIAGQFGAHLPVESLIGAGILPAEVQDKLEYVGNSSKTGAYMTLLSEKAKQEVKELAEKMEYFELAQTQGYERLFADCMTFPTIKNPEGII